MAKLHIVGSRAGLQKIQMISILCNHTKLGLKVSKDYTDAVLEGEIVTIELEDVAKAEALANELEKIGAITKLEQKA